MRTNATSSMISPRTRSHQSSRIASSRRSTMHWPLATESRVARDAPAAWRYTSDTNIAACSHWLAADDVRNFGVIVAITAPSASSCCAAASGSRASGLASASSVTITSPRAASMPCFSAQIFPTQPDGSGAPRTTRAPFASAIAAVSSLDSSSTTITSTTPGAPRRGAKHSAIRCDSLRAGTTTLMRGIDTESLAARPLAVSS